MRDMAELENGQTHKYTQTKYRNPSAHARRGLIIITAWITQLGIRV